MRNAKVVPAAVAFVVLCGTVALVPGHAVVAVASSDHPSVMVWGEGQGIDGADAHFPSPVRVLRNVTALAAGGHVGQRESLLSLALTRDGTVWNSFTATRPPRRVTGLGRGRVVGISARNNSAVVVKHNGEVIPLQVDDSTGEATGTPPILGRGSGVTEVAAGSGHYLARRADGTVLAWGDDTFGQLGTAAAETCEEPYHHQCSETPVQVDGLGPGSGVVAIAAGGGHSLALKADGTVLAWGDNDGGQLGTSSATPCGPSHPRPCSKTPLVVSGLGPGSGVRAIAAGERHNLALTTDGTVLQWGDLDPPLGAPTAVQGLGPGSGVVGVAAGGVDLARRADGTLLAWNDAQHGMLGDGLHIYAYSKSQPRLEPLPVLGIRAVTTMAAGESHALAVGVSVPAINRALWRDAGAVHRTQVLYGPPGGAIDVFGTGYRPGEPVRVTLGTGLSAPPDALGCATTADATGQFRCAAGISVPHALGEFTLRALGQWSGREATSTFTVAAPTLNDLSAPAGSVRGINGHGFADETVTISYRTGLPAPYPEWVQICSGAAYPEYEVRALHCRAEIPAQPLAGALGPHEIVAIGSVSQLPARATFTLTAE